MGFLRSAAKLLSSPIAAPGMIFILYGCGIDYTHLLAPTPDAPTMAAKFSTIGISEDLVRSGVSVLVGSLGC